MPYPMLPRPTHDQHRALEILGVVTWVHDKIYALVPDRSQPHGYRLVGSAESYDAIITQLADKLKQTGRL